MEAMQTMLLTCLEFQINKRPPGIARVRGLSHAIDMLTTIRQLSIVDDRNRGKEGWIDNLKSFKFKLLEDEIHSFTKVEN